MQMQLTLSYAGTDVVKLVSSRRKKRTTPTGHSVYLCVDRQDRDEVVERLELSHGYQRVSFEWQLQAGCFMTGWGERVMQFEKRNKDGEIVQPEIRETRPKVVWIEPENEEERVN